MAEEFAAFTYPELFKLRIVLRGLEFTFDCFLFFIAGPTIDLESLTNFLDPRL